MGKVERWFGTAIPSSKKVQSLPVSNLEIEKALATAAKVIHLYGFKYWPLFERLESELEARHDQHRRVSARLVRNESRRDDTAWANNDDHYIQKQR